MPELPEIESLRLTLAPSICGRTIRQTIVRRRHLRFPLPRGFANAISGVRVKALQRRGKYLLIALSSKKVLIAHLGMSGRLLFRKKQPYHKHDHVAFIFPHGELVFHDPRRFGFLDLVGEAQLAAHPRLARLGPEPLAKNWTAAHLANSLRARKTSLKSALLNQKIIAGLGNIYTCEALHAARLHPERAAASLTDRQYRALHRAIVAQLRRAINAGGSTLRDYLNANGQPGYFQHQFRVYQRVGQACRCGAEIAHIRQAGRSTFYCPQCQK